MGRSRVYEPPNRTNYRLIVQNLASRVSWEDLKHFMRQVGEVTFADAHRLHRNEGIVEFASYRDMRNAIEKLDEIELNGRRIRLLQDRNTKPRRFGSYSSRSTSRSSSPRRSRSRSHSNCSSHSKSRSRSRFSSGSANADHDCGNKSKARSRSNSRQSADCFRSKYKRMRMECSELRSHSRTPERRSKKSYEVFKECSRSASRSISRDRSNFKCRSPSTT